MAPTDQMNKKRQYDLPRIIVCFVFASIIMSALLLFWGQNTAVNHLLINDRVVSKSTLNGSIVYSLDISNIEYTNGSSLHFKSFGNAVLVSADGQEIYSYGQNYADDHLDIGRVYVSALLPKDTKTLVITLTPSDVNAVPCLKKIDLCAIEDYGRYYLSNDTLGMPMALIYCSLGVSCFIFAFALRAIEGKKNIRWALLFFSLSLICISIELADTGGHHLVLFDDQQKWNVMFYCAAYLLPVVSSLYCYAIISDFLTKRQKQIAYIGVWISAAYALFATAIPLLTDVRFSDLFPVFPYTLVLNAIFGLHAVVCLLKNKKIDVIYIAFFIVIFFWNIGATILATTPDLTISTTKTTLIDIESIESILLLNMLGMSLLVFINKELRKKEQQEIDLIRLESDLKDMRYKVFASQMQPHFLYNALSSIRQIIYEDKDGASDLLADFTVHLRSTIRAMTNDKPIPFSDELKNIEAYVGIEKMRFEDKLRVCYDIQADQFQVIPLSIQPLVENAIRHGIYNKEDDVGAVTLRTREEGNAWKVEVIDDGIGFDVEGTLSKIDGGEKDSAGLRNLIFRLEYLMQATVKIESTLDIGTHITVTIPKKEELL